MVKAMNCAALSNFKAHIIANWKTSIAGDTMAKTLKEQDEEIKAMEEKFGGKWEELCLELVNVPCGHALDLLWKDVILSKDPNYGDWEYPGQAYRHLIAEYRELKAFYDAAMEHLTTTTFLMVKSAAAEKVTNPAGKE